MADQSANEDEPKEILNEICSLLLQGRVARRIGEDGVARVNSWVRKIRVAIKEDHKGERTVVKYYCRQLLGMVRRGGRALG